MGNNKQFDKNYLPEFSVKTALEIAQKREYKIVYLLISALANICCANEDMVINALTNILWDSEEAQKLLEIGEIKE